MTFEADFEAPLWRWNDGAWQFVALPHDVSDQIDDLVPDKAGFGSVKVEVTVGTMTWSTSVFPSKEHSSFVLPIKKAVRVKNEVDEGDLVQVHLKLAT
ncbi:MAG TPA: DUF1905 domain-containing protein [Mycobacteriales bacterium]|nr:DUF1905 domain-containing protein [Mycobacteriales bacterium]